VNGRTASIAVIAASAAVLAFVVLDRTGAPMGRTFIFRENAGSSRS